MKVLNITYNKRQGGLEAMFLNYHRACLSFGWNVTSMLPKKALLLNDLKKEAGDIVETTFLSSRYHWLNPFAIIWLRRRIKYIKPDVIILHNARPYSLIKLASRNICPVIVVNHSDDIDKVEHVANIFTITRYNQRDLESCPKFYGNIYYMPNMVNYTRSDASQRLVSDKLVIGYIGRFCHLKGAKRLLEAAKFIKGSYEIVIAGEGEEAEKFKEYVQRFNIEATFLGWVDGVQKQQFFEKIDVLIVPSLHEAFGLVILEGWAAKVPVISSKTKGGCELIENGVNGFLYDIDSAEALAAAIHALRTTDVSAIIANATSSLEVFKEENFRCTLRKNLLTVIELGK